MPAPRRHHLTLTMPPLPVTFDDAAKALIESLERRQKDIREFQIPRLRTCKGPLSLQQQYAAEIREDIDVFAKQLEVRSIPMLKNGRFEM